MKRASLFSLALGLIMASPARTTMAGPPRSKISDRDAVRAIISDQPAPPTSQPARKAGLFFSIAQVAQKKDNQGTRLRGGSSFGLLASQATLP